MQEHGERCDAAFWKIANRACIACAGKNFWGKCFGKNLGESMIAGVEIFVEGNFVEGCEEIKSPIDRWHLYLFYFVEIFYCIKNNCCQQNTNDSNSEFPINNRKFDWK